MFQFGPFATWLAPGSRGCPIRKSVDQRLCAAPHSLSQLYTSFIASPCQGIRRVPFVTWSFLQSLHRCGARTQKASPYIGYSLTYHYILLANTAPFRGASPTGVGACLLRSHHVKELVGCVPGPTLSVVPRRATDHSVATHRVELRGFEPRTPCLQSRCSSQLSYSPRVRWAWQELNLRPHAYQACA